MKLISTTCGQVPHEAPDLVQNFGESVEDFSHQISWKSNKEPCETNVSRLYPVKGYLQPSPTGIIKSVLRSLALSWDSQLHKQRVGSTLCACNLEDSAFPALLNCFKESRSNLYIHVIPCIRYTVYINPFFGIILERLNLRIDAAWEFRSEFSS